MKIKPRAFVMLHRDNLATDLAPTIPTFAFHNPGLVLKVLGKRACVAWPGYNSMWFDFEALTLAV